MRILRSLALLPLLVAPLAAAAPAATTPALQAPSHATIINQKSPGSEGGAGGGGCDISRCPPICEHPYPPGAASSICYGGPKSCDWIDRDNKAHCTCVYNHPMVLNW